MFKRPVHAGSAHLALLAALVIVTVSATSGCSHHTKINSPSPVAPQLHAQDQAKIGTMETGIASWYGDPYHGRPTASGEIFDKEQFTAAHPSLPFQTWVEVTDLDNGKKVTVRIIDRGPFVKGRIIDLSLAAAREIEMVGPGTARVKLKVIAPPKTNSTDAHLPNSSDSPSEVLRSNEPPPSMSGAPSACLLADGTSCHTLNGRPRGATDGARQNKTSRGLNKDAQRAALPPVTVLPDTPICAEVYPQVAKGVSL